MGGCSSGSSVALPRPEVGAKPFPFDVRNLRLLPYPPGRLAEGFHLIGRFKGQIFNFTDFSLLFDGFFKLHRFLLSFLLFSFFCLLQAPLALLDLDS